MKSIFNCLQVAVLAVTFLAGQAATVSDLGGVAGAPRPVPGSPGPCCIQPPWGS